MNLQRLILSCFFLFALSIFLFWANSYAAKAATTYHVCDCAAGADGNCQEGNDTNSGTDPSAPFRSYGKARTTFNSMNAGDTIAFCKGGAFPPSGSSSRWFNGNCRANNRCTIESYTPPRASGNENKPKIYKDFNLSDSGNQDQEEGYIFRDLHLDGKEGIDFGIYIYKDVDDVLIDNMTIENFGIGVHLGGAGFTVPNPGSNGLNERIVLRNSVIRNNHSQGWLGSSNGGRIENNHFENNGFSKAIFNHNIYWSGVADTTNGIIHNNTLYRSAVVDGKCAGTSLVVHGVHSDLTIEGNLIYEDLGKAEPTCFGISVNGGYGETEAFDRLKIRANKVVNVGSASIGCQGCINSVIEENIVIQEQEGLTSTLFSIPNNNQPEPTKNITIRNNIGYFGPKSGRGNSINTGIKMHDNGGGRSFILNNTIYKFQNETCVSVEGAVTELNTTCAPASDQWIEDNVNNNAFDDEQREARKERMERGVRKEKTERVVRERRGS
jgi:hypothetical protein